MISIKAKYHRNTGFFHCHIFSQVSHLDATNTFATNTFATNSVGFHFRIHSSEFTVLDYALNMLDVVWLCHLGQIMPFKLRLAQNSSVNSALTRSNLTPNNEDIRNKGILNSACLQNLIVFYSSELDIT